MLASQRMCAQPWQCPCVLGGGFRWHDQEASPAPLPLWCYVVSGRLFQGHSCATGHCWQCWGGGSGVVLIELNKCFGVINVFHPGKVNDLEHFQLTVCFH